MTTENQTAETLNNNTNGSYTESHGSSLQQAEATTALSTEIAGVEEPAQSPQEETEKVVTTAKQPLTKREHECLQCIASGFTNKEIGEELSISVKTVEAHRARIFRKLRVNNSPQAIMAAINRGLLNVPVGAAVNGERERCLYFTNFILEAVMKEPLSDDTKECIASFYHDIENGVPF